MKSIRNWTLVGNILNGILCAVGVLVVIVAALLLCFGFALTTTSLADAGIDPEFSGTGLLVLLNQIDTTLGAVLDVALVAIGILFVMLAIESAVPLALGYNWLKKERRGALGQSLGRGNATARLVLDALTLVAAIWVFYDSQDQLVNTIIFFKGIATATHLVCIIKIGQMGPQEKAAQTVGHGAVAATASASTAATTDAPKSERKKPMSEIVDSTCPNCAAQLHISKYLQQARCPYCDSVFTIDHGDMTQTDKSASELWPDGKPKIAPADKSPYATMPGQMPPDSPVKKNMLWLWILGWLFCFPVPLTLLLSRKKDMNKVLMVFIMVLAWVAYALILWFYW